MSNFASHQDNEEVACVAFAAVDQLIRVLKSKGILRGADIAGLYDSVRISLESSENMTCNNAARLIPRGGSSVEYTG